MSQKKPFLADFVLRKPAKFTVEALPEALFGQFQNFRIAILNDSVSPRLTHVTAKVTGVGPGVNVGVYDTGSLGPHHSNPTMTDFTVTASGGSSKVGVVNDDGSPTIKQSKLSGSGGNLSAALQQDGGSATVALAQLVGPVRRDPGATVRCFNS